jgi:hypothetical protein
VAAQPGDIAAAGVQAQAGVELGLTYRAPEAGLALVVGYGGTFGTANTLHQASGWLAGVLRPGQARLSLGPTYSFMAVLALNRSPTNCTSPAKWPTVSLRASCWPTKWAWARPSKPA